MRQIPSTASGKRELMKPQKHPQKHPKLADLTQAESMVVWDVASLASSCFRAKVG